MKLLITSPKALAAGLHATGTPPPEHVQDQLSGRYARGFLRALQAAGLGEQDVALELVALVALWLDERVILEAESRRVTARRPGRPG